MEKACWSQTGLAGSLDISQEPSRSCPLPSNAPTGNEWGGGGGGGGGGDSADNEQFARGSSPLGRRRSSLACARLVREAKVGDRGVRFAPWCCSSCPAERQRTTAPIRSGCHQGAVYQTKAPRLRIEQDEGSIWRAWHVTVVTERRKAGSSSLLPSCTEEVRRSLRRRQVPARITPSRVPTFRVPTGAVGHDSLRWESADAGLIFGRSCRPRRENNGPLPVTEGQAEHRRQGHGSRRCPPLVTARQEWTPVH